MLLIPQLLPRTEQPQDGARIDPSHPLAGRIVAAYLPAISASNLARGPGVLGSHAAPTVALPQSMLATSITATNLRITSDRSFGPTPSYPITMVWVGQQGGTTNTQIAGITSASGIGGSYCYIGGGSSTLVGYSARNNFGSAMGLLVAVPGGSALGVEMVIVAQSLSATNHRISVNGSAVATDSTNIGALVAWDRVFFGQSASSNSQQTAAFIVASGGAGLSDEQMQQLSRSPSEVYALFEPQRIAVPVPAGAGSVAIISAAGSASAASIVGASAAAGAASASAGAAAASVLGGAASAAASVTASAGAATASTLIGSATIAAAIGSASGAATTSALAGTSFAAAAITASSGSATVSTLTGVAGTGSSVGTAAGAATASTLVGKASVSATILAASGATSAVAMAGSADSAAAIAFAVGAATASTLVGSTAGASSAFSAATGAASAQIMVGASFAAAAIGAAAGASTAATLAGGGGLVALSAPPLGRRTSSVARATTAILSRRFSSISKGTR